MTKKRNTMRRIDMKAAFYKAVQRWKEAWTPTLDEMLELISELHSSSLSTMQELNVKQDTVDTNTQIERGIKKLTKHLKSPQLTKDDRAILSAMLQGIKARALLRKYPEKEEF